MSQFLPSAETFVQQVRALAAEHGAAAFCAAPGQSPSYSLFVDDQVVAEPRGKPRHPYGLYCELPVAQAGKVLEDYFDHWLDSGQAYEQFLAINACRYNCGD